MRAAVSKYAYILTLSNTTSSDAEQPVQEEQETLVSLQLRRQVYQLVRTYVERVQQVVAMYKQKKNMYSTIQRELNEPRVQLQESVHLSDDTNSVEKEHIQQLYIASTEQCLQYRKLSLPQPPGTSDAGSSEALQKPSSSDEVLGFTVQINKPSAGNAQQGGLQYCIRRPADVLLEQLPGKCVLSMLVYNMLTLLYNIYITC